MSKPSFDAVVWAWLLGMIGGCVGGAFGALLAVLASRGKAKRFVMTAHAVVIIVSFGVLILGIVDLATGQPYGAWYCFVLPGVLGLIIFGGLYLLMKRRYAEVEMRRSKAADL